MTVTIPLDNREDAVAFARRIDGASIYWAGTAYEMHGPLRAWAEPSTHGKVWWTWRVVVADAGAAA